MVHPFFVCQKISSEDIYTSDLDLFPLSGAWVAMGRRPEDKSGLFFLTGNRRTEQHWSSLIHYPPLHLAHPGTLYVFIWTFQWVRSHTWTPKHTHTDRERVTRSYILNIQSNVNICSHLFWLILDFDYQKVLSLFAAYILKMYFSQHWFII